VFYNQPQTPRRSPGRPRKELTDEQLTAHRAARLLKIGITTPNALLLPDLQPRLDRLLLRRDLLLRRQAAIATELATLATEEAHLRTELSRSPTS